MLDLYDPQPMFYPRKICKIYDDVGIFHHVHQVRGVVGDQLGAQDDRLLGVQDGHLLYEQDDHLLGVQDVFL
jgi:hypothetical protein